MASKARTAWHRWGARGLVPLLAVAMVGVFVITAQATTYTGGVQDTGLFQLDRNTLPSTCGLPEDWAALYTDQQINLNDPPCHSDSFKFVNDKIGKQGDNTYWSQGGSKDAYDPALGPWLVSSNDVSPDKNDLVNAFASIYHGGQGTPTVGTTTSSDQFLFFGADRFNTNGDAQMGFQFLQARTCIATINCPNGPTPPATPNQTANAGKFVNPDTGVPIHHKNGDLLILVNFNNGGTLGLAGVFSWTGADGNGAGSYQNVLSSGTSTANPPADCATIGDPNQFCATSSTGNEPGDPVWPYTAKGVSGQASYSASSFIEGGVNLGAIAGAGSCFPSFIAETRSSAGSSSGLSLSAQLKDLAFGQFENCGSTTKTTPSSTSDGATAIPAAGLSIGTGSTGVDVYDKAQVTVSGTSSFGGSVTFHLCGPTPLSDTGYTLCTTGGHLIGSSPGVSPPSPVTVVSDAAHLTSAGRYCWRADYSGDAVTGVPPSSDSAVSECFKINPVTPTLTTQAGTSPVTLGDAVTDTASLVGTSYEPGTGGVDGSSVGDPTHSVTRTTKAQGQITFSLYKDDCSTLATGTGTNPQSVTVNGDDNTGAYAASFTPDSPGTYHWVASYNGDSPNTNGTDDNNPCSASLARETVVVQKVPTSISTAQWVYPNDKATIATTDVSTGDVAGSVKFRLFDSLSDCQAGTPSDTVGTGGLLYRQIVTLSGTHTSEDALTTNTTVKIDTSTTVYWLVEFTSTNPKQFSRVSSCAESTQTTFVNDAGPGTQP